MNNQYVIIYVFKVVISLHYQLLSLFFGAKVLKLLWLFTSCRLFNGVNVLSELLIDIVPNLGLISLGD